MLEELIPDDPPYVIIESEKIVFTSTVRLEGTVLDDGLPQPPGLITSLWTQVDGPGVVTFENASATNTVAELPAEGTYVVKLTGYDGLSSYTEETTIAFLKDPERISMDSAPTVVAPNTYANLTVSYESREGLVTDTRYILAQLLDLETDEVKETQVLGTGLSIGSGIATGRMLIPASSPPGATYGWIAYLIASGQKQDNYFGISETIPVLIQAGDEFEVQDHPTHILPLGSHQVRIAYNTKEYVSLHNRKIVIDLLSVPSHSGWNGVGDDFVWYGQGMVEVGAGQIGVAMVEVEIADIPPPPGSHYIWNVFVTVDDENVADTFSSNTNRVTVLEGDSIEFISAPTTIRSTGTYQVEVNFTTHMNVATNVRDLQINLLSSDTFEWFGGTRVSGIMPESTGTLSVAITLANAPSPGTHYNWSSFIGPVSGAFEDRYASAKSDPVTVDDSVVPIRRGEGLESLIYREKSLRLAWPVQSGLVYSVERSTNLVGEEWIPVGDLPSRTDGEIVFTNNAILENNHFFRILTEPKNP